MHRNGPDDTKATAHAPAARAEKTGKAEASREVLPPALWRLFVLVWLLFLYYPLLAQAQAHSAPLQLAMTLTGTALFAVLYLYLALPLPFGEATPGRLSAPAHRTPLALAVLLTADIVLLTLLAGADWLWFFIFVSIALGARLPPRPATIAVAGTAVLTVVVGTGPFGWVYAVRVALPVAVVGFGMIGVGWLVATIRELRTARVEIARLAVAEERLRFARDLHDLLGHSLSAITLKNEVARSLVPTQPERAVQELGDAIGLAREALREVRATVSGYRQPTLAVEIRSARALLDAAGIACDVRGLDDDSGAMRLPPQVEAVLAWTVREGVTNVVRYSGASHCTITGRREIERETETVVVEICDDGHGTPSLTPDLGMGVRSGTGLRGLAERAAQVGGHMRAGTREPSGFRLCVTVPVPAQSPGSGDDSAIGDSAASQQRVIPQ